MPFNKLGPNKYRGPSGKVFNYNQVRLYYSLGGKFPGQKGGNASKPGSHRSAPASEAGSKGRPR
jgi:hypothetical protein